MKSNQLPAAVGISSAWPSRKTVIKALQATSQESVAKIKNYICRADVKNSRNVVERSTFSIIANQQEAFAICHALLRKPWLPTLAYSTAYRLFADKLDYFWHHNFRLIFPDHPSPLQMFNWESSVIGLGHAFILGWKEEAIYQGYLIHSALKHEYQLALSYEERHRCAHAFMLRLFADWRGDVSHSWPSYAYDEPIYEGLLEHWRNPDSELLMPWLLAACDRHTHQAAREISNTFYDFGSPALARTPIEILMLLRLREFIGLSNPIINHPLMDAPFDRLPEEQVDFVSDEFMNGTFARARLDWPSIDQVLSIGSMMR